LATVASVTANPSSTYLVGRGISDVTGEAAGCGMLGYGKADQLSAGIHARLRTRAFVIVDSRTDARVLLSVSDLPLMFDSVHREVLQRLAQRYGDLYSASNVMLTVTHTHCGPGGYSHHRLYNMTTNGFHPKTFGAIVDGILEAAARAHADIAPAELKLSRGELLDASINRSPESFERNPTEDKAFFPDQIDPQTTLLRIERAGKVVGAINWFATHGTSMTNRNRLISGDNKGYAGYHWERVVHGVDYLAGDQPEFIAAFAQTNAGDMSPNLNRAPGSGPTGNDFENTRIIGRRQAEAAASLVSEPGDAVTGGIDARFTYVDLSDVTVRPEFTPDGKIHRTSHAMGGAAALAGTEEGPGFPGFRQGQGSNPLFDRLSRGVVYRLSAEIRDAQAPKAIVLPGGMLNNLISLVQETVPVQLLRIGQLYLIGIPGEVTITAGLRMRRAVASVVAVELHNVLVAGYSNAYIHYVTTPEEYDAQRYEGGSTLFGRWEAPALTQVVVELATAMRDGKPVEVGTPPPDVSALRKSKRAGGDQPVQGYEFGSVIVQPRPGYRPGEQVRAVFAGANPNNDLHRGGTFVEVEREADGSWQRIADDGDWETKFKWAKSGRLASRITVTWDIPNNTVAGMFRIRYSGDVVDGGGKSSPFTGTTAAFAVDAE